MDNYMNANILSILIKWQKLFRLDKKARHNMLSEKKNHFEDKDTHRKSTFRMVDQIPPKISPSIQAKETLPTTVKINFL